MPDNENFGTKITVLTGATGSGKSHGLITRVLAASEAGRRVETFVCSTYPWPRNNRAYWEQRYLVCRVPGLRAPLDHFVSLEGLASIVRGLPTETLVAIEEAFAFGTAVTPIIRSAVERGLEVIMAHPSGDQLASLEGPYKEERYSVMCERCGKRDGSEPIIPWDGAWTQTVCHDCFALMREEARALIVDELRAYHPDPGQEALYQPIPLPEVETWRLARNDTLVRAEVVEDELSHLGLVKQGRAMGRLSYLDMGCCTGSFCNYFASRGFSSKGIDAVEAYVGVARLMDSFFRRPVRRGGEFVLYDQASAYDYLRDTADEHVDVSSAFAVFQWVMVQRGYDNGVECLGLLANKTRQVMVVEMPYTSEEHYSDKIGATIDREWVLQIIRPFFDSVKVVGAGARGIKRDLFIAVKFPSRA